MAIFYSSNRSSHTYNPALATRSLGWLEGGYAQDMNALQEKCGVCPTLCDHLSLEELEMQIGNLLRTGCVLDDLLQPRRIDLQLHHRIEQKGLLDHFNRVRKVLQN